MKSEKKYKEILSRHRGQNISDGAGIKLRRFIGTEKLPEFDPFLILDEFKSDDPFDYIKGFPDHPHRGIEKITYMKQGKLHHRDSKGNESFLTSGHVQWITAGKGIIHSEMPEMDDGLLWGYQLWLNLPAKFKMIEAKYQDIKSAEIPSYTNDNVDIKVISGQYQDLKGPGKSFYPFSYYDLTLKANSMLEIPVDDSFNVFIYLYSGKLLSGSPSDTEEILNGSLITYNIGNCVYLQTLFSNAELLLFAAPPLNEPIVRGGPFVMNSEEELYQAYRDYQEGKLDK